VVDEYHEMSRIRGGCDVVMVERERKARRVKSELLAAFSAVNTDLLDT
jgi:hypothetical protein